MKNMFVALGLGLGAVLGTSQPASAQVEPYIGQVMVFAGSFCPRGWMPAQGQLLTISQNAALYSVLGPTYGGDGHNTFALPDLRGRAVLGAGNGADTPPATIGTKAGAVPVASPGEAITTPTLVLQACIATDGLYPARQ